MLLLIDNAPGHPRALVETQHDSCCFYAYYTTSILQPMDQGVISTFRSYYLRNIFCKVVAAIDIESSSGFWQSKLKTFWEGFIIPDAIKIIRDSWEDVKISLIGVWKKLVPTLMDDFEGSRSVEEGIADVVEIARELELEVEPEDVTKLLQSHDKALMGEELLVMDEQRKWFFEMEATSAEDTKYIVKITTNNLEYYINLV